MLPRMKKGMARGGIRLGPNGEVLQGRKPGSLDRATLEREIVALKAALAAAQAPKTGEKTDLDVLEEIRDYWLGVAAAELAKETPDQEVVARAHDRAESAASKRAPYKHAKLSNVTLRDDPLDLTRCTADELAFLARIRARVALGRGDQSGNSPTAH